MTTPTNPTVAAICGVCLDVKRAHYEPSACFVCRANFEAGAPVALVRIEIGVGLSVDRVGVSVAPKQRIDSLGRWTAEHRERALTQLGMVEDENATGRAVDGG